MDIPLSLWRSLIISIRSRGRGIRESGAFLLGAIGGERITRFIPYDDLDPHCLDEGIIVFDGRYFVALWKICEEEKLQVLADVHTHSGIWTGQSKLDKTNPMISMEGHLALILPNYAQNHFLDFRGIGIYEYLGDNKWTTWPLVAGKIKWKII